MKRLFFALWPDEEIRGKVAGVVRAIRNERFKKVRIDNIHVTLVFLGSVDTEQEIALKEGAANLKVESLQLDFDRLTLWRRPGILSLTCSQQPPPLLELVAGLTRLAVECGLEVDQRPYQAHVTLARKAYRKPEIELEPLLWPAGDFALVESAADEGGVRYQVLQSWPLGAGE